jgi:hypothetical protein
MDAGIVPFGDLALADLVVDRVYQGGTTGNASDDPLARLLPVGNQGGFRYRGSVAADQVRVAVLYTTGREPDWPDSLDPYTGDFTYYGDNRSPGNGLHNTQRQGNTLLQKVFAWSRKDASSRARVPPFLLFDKPGTGRDVRFRGLLVPGSPRLSGEEELIAVWRSTGGARFQNYRAHFTVLDVPVIARAWLDEVLAGDALSATCPPAWRAWVASRAYRPLQAPPTVILRTRDEQLPLPQDLPLLQEVYRHFEPQPTAFEQFAADLWRLSEPHVHKVDVTRPWRDGGRDAVGEFMIGPAADPVAVEFALEAKCYEPGGSSVGVKEMSRLVSRLRHRQFGVLVTTSYVNSQAYREIREDGHPVVILAGRDIVAVLKAHGLETVAQLRRHLGDEYRLPAL